MAPVTPLRSLLSFVLLAACGPAPSPDPSPDRPTVTLRPSPEVGVVYEILHRETREVGDASPVQLDTRTLLEVTELRPDGSRAARAHVRRSYPPGFDIDEPLRSGTVALSIDADGRLREDPSDVCDTVDEARTGRYLRHLLGARALVADDVGVGARWRGELLTDAAELPQPARFGLDEIDHVHAQGRVSSPVTVEQGDVGGVRVTGSGTVRGRFRVRLDDGFSGRSELLTMIDGEIYEHGQTRSGTVRVRSEILVRPAQSTEPDAFECVGVFDPSTVTARIRSHIRVIQECYEVRLREDPELAGRVMVRFTIEETGRVSDARVTEDSIGDEGQVAQCVVDTISRFVFDPAPVGGSVTFAYPFVFAPQN